jgi:hypothetical protein
MTRKPLDQGDLDGFCGMYSIINALTLLFPSHMNGDARASLFEILLKAIPQHKWPFPIINGTTQEDVRHMLHGARNYLSSPKNSATRFDWEQPFRYQKLSRFDEFHRELQWRIAGDDAFGIVGMSKPWEHWTCAHRLTEHEMIMTDSCHVKQIPLVKCGLTGDGADYEFDFRQTFTVMRAK